MRLSSRFAASPNEMRAGAGTRSILVAGVFLCGIAGCGVDDPGRLTTNQRVAEIVFDAGGAIVPTGELTVEGSGQSLSADVNGLPILPLHSGHVSGYVYSGWISYPDTGTVRAYVSTGRFRVAEASTNPEYPTGNIRFTYDRSGTLTVQAGGTALTHGAPMPDTLEFQESRFFIAIEPDPDADEGPGRTHLLIGESDLPATDEIELVIPVNEELGTIGDFSSIQGQALVNVATGEFALTLTQMPYISRSTPPQDPGIIYQAWFVDDDGTFPRYQNILRFNPNAVGDFGSTGVMNPGDGDGDGVPEPLDFERIVISIEPDALTAQQPVTRGADTSPDIFSIVPYLSQLPDIRD